MLESGRRHGDDHSLDQLLLRAVGRLGQVEEFVGRNQLLCDRGHPSVLGEKGSPKFYRTAFSPQTRTRSPAAAPGRTAPTASASSPATDAPPRRTAAPGPFLPASARGRRAAGTGRRSASPAATRRPPPAGRPPPA